MTRATIGIFSLHVGRMGTACQHDGLEEEAHRFSLHFGDVEADVVQQIGIVLEIGAQLRPEGSALRPHRGQPEHLAQRRDEGGRRACQCAARTIGLG
ncbi:MAG: hypothetical protein ACK5E0_03975 [Bradyrhizobium sp.]